MTFSPKSTTETWHYALLQLGNKPVLNVKGNVRSKKKALFNQDFQLPADALLDALFEMSWEHLNGF